MFIFTLVYTIIISFTMIGFGFHILKKPPQNINLIFGYRTTMSTKNRETWDFANRYAGKVWLLSGIINIIVSIFLLIIFKNSRIFNNIMVVLIYIQLGVLLMVIPITEVALRKVFDKNGNKKF